MSEPEWMKQYKMIGQRGHQDVEQTKPDASVNALTKDKLEVSKKEAHLCSDGSEPSKSFANARRSLGSFLDSIDISEVAEKESLCSDGTEPRKSFVNARRSLGAFLDSLRCAHQDSGRVFCGIVVRKDGTRVRRFKRVNKEPSNPLSPTDESIASPYRKMLSVGVPDGGVREKMLQDGVPKHIIRAVITRDNKPYIRQDGRMVRMVKRQKQRKPNLLNGPTAGMDPKDIAEPYEKLLKDGIMKPGAVKQKMILDGVVSRQVFDMVEAAAKATQEIGVPTNRFATKQRGMLGIRGRSVGCSGRGALLRAIAGGRGRGPPGRRETARSLDNIPEKRLVQRHQWRTLLPKGPTTDLKPKDIAAPYEKLLKMGIMPLGAVKQKMMLDGVVSESVMHIIDTAAAAAAAKSNSEEHDSTAFYRRMLKRGQPAWVVRMKMASDGVSQEIQDAIAPAPTTTTATRGDGSTEFYRNLLRMGMSAEDARVQMTIEGVAPEIREVIAPAPTAVGRTDRRAGRGGLLRAIAAAGRGRGPPVKRETSPHVGGTLGKISVVRSSLDEDALIQKIQTIEERHKKCLTLLDRLYPKVARDQRES